MQEPLPLLAALGALVLGARVAAQDVAEHAVHPESGQIYVRSAEVMDVFEALALARVMGGTLVCIGSAEEENFLLENFGAEELYWIGLEFPRERWLSGELAGFTHWTAGEPSGTTTEPFTLMNWNEPGAWGDVSGNVENHRYRALIELPPEIALGPQPALPTVRRANRGVLLVAIQGLTQRDLESPRNARLHEVWKDSAWTADAGADEGGDALASLGMLLWGVGPAKSQLARAEPGRASRKTNENLLARLERFHPSVQTAALLDDPALAGILMDGRVDLRHSGASPRKGGSLEPLKAALALATPLCLVATWSDLGIGDEDAGHEVAHAKEIAAIDQELGALLDGLRARADYAHEEWWIAVTGITPDEDGKKKLDDRRARSAVPLVLRGSGALPGELLGETSLVDLLPTALGFLGVDVRRSFGLDGHALALARGAFLGENLVVNGGAEAQFDWTPAEFPLLTGWRRLGGFRSGRHDASTPPEFGRSFFQGSGTEARLEQTIDLRALAADADRGGGLRYRLHGWLGAGAEPTASVELALEFLNEQKKPLARAVLGPVGAGAGKASNATGLLELSATGKVPRRTRAARLILSATGATGVERTMADELSLVLTQD